MHVRVGRSLVVGVVLLGSCGGREVGLRDADRFVEPTFVTEPVDLADSTQLDAFVARDTGGLAPTKPSADGSLLAPALAALLAMPDAPTELSRLTVYDDNVYFTFPSETSGLSRTMIYHGPSDISVADPRFDDTPAYPIDRVDVNVAAELVDAIERRIPDVVVTQVDLELPYGYGFGLAWYVQIADARGRVAIAWADLDGSIIALDMD